MIAIKLIDEEGNENSYEMKFTLRMPHIYFSEDLPPFSITNGEYSVYSLPDIVVAEDSKLRPSAHKLHFE